MSIDDEIEDRVNRGMLWPLLPRVPGDVIRRALLVGERLWALLNSPKGDVEWEKRVGELRADLEVLVTQEDIDPKYLFLLSPASDGVWEIRSVKDDPSMRVLGMFAARDIYVAADIALREDLGGWNSREWKQVKRNARVVWRQLFNTYSPIISIDVNDVITGAVDGRYLK